MGIGSGVVVASGLLAAKRLEGWTALFLTSTVATSLTGFGFPVEHLLPSHVVGALSLIVLAVAILARYALHLSGGWRWIYVVCTVLALYLNVFVGIVQVFLKVPGLRAAAPTQSETPFVLTLTITGLAAEATLAGGSNPRWPRRIASVLTMAAGAAAGVVLLRQSLVLPLAVCAVVACACSLTVHRWGWGKPVTPV